MRLSGPSCTDRHGQTLKLCHVGIPDGRRPGELAAAEHSLTRAGRQWHRFRPLWPTRSSPMRSFLFIPGDSPKKLEKGLGSGADALLLDLEDSISPQNKAAARDTTLAFLKEAVPVKARPRIYVRINGLQTGLTDADLDVIVGGKPDGVMFPKAEGGAAVTHCDAKLTAREAIHGLPDGALDIIAIATETAQAIFLAGTYGGASKRLKG